MKPPTYFISSTIYDFRDLRSALKFYLEEQGCTVLASEHNDFLKPLDKHSYEACLETVERADYFVLLIGSRIGGWYDPQNRVSITQKEYRHAYDLQKSGKLKILSFVRSEVWQSREDRKELARYLESLPIGEVEKKEIRNFPSKFADDATFISDFISEVGRNRETVLALRDGSMLPSGNWIHVFHDFREVIAAVQAQMFSGIPVAESALRRLLKSELEGILRQCLPKSQKHLIDPRVAVKLFRQKHTLSKESRESDFLVIHTKEWDLLSWVLYSILAVKIYPVILDSAVVSPFFLAFSRDLNTFEETPIHRAILALRDQIRRFNESNTPETLSVLFEYSPKQRGGSAATIKVEFRKVANLLHLCDRWLNIIELCIALHRYLDGKPFHQPTLSTKSPIEGLGEEIEAETGTFEEILNFINAEVSQ